MKRFISIKSLPLQWCCENRFRDSYRPLQRIKRQTQYAKEQERHDTLPDSRRTVEQ